jgi:hypothetical protein
MFACCGDGEYDIRGENDGCCCMGECAGAPWAVPCGEKCGDACAWWTA